MLKKMTMKQERAIVQEEEDVKDVAGHSRSGIDDTCRREQDGEEYKQENRDHAGEYGKEERERLILQIKGRPSRKRSS
ncbi:hypothetical protein FGU65_08370 [Methanoculleus sp. FWC-SCC1]|uniref:Uncharacterized protein n=1 Tax=Methanoculleus frigidifontis TaxID=2584085 RepID=A0ABT8MAJ2_9EURY|nr:hypothetical protein [Methanoculleus sp. FWC-SCC1]MDN7024901.1 hypothetical protein [Methanoculleus sp. FWC-SCC1]